jgi:signal transduction histidine kinase
MKHFRLFWKIYLHGVLLLLLVSGGLICGTGLFRRDAEWRDLHVRLAEHLAEHTAPRVHAHSEELGGYLEHLRSVLGVDLTYYDEKGTLLASNVDPPIPPPDPRELVQLSHEGVHCTSHTKWRIVAPLEASGQHLGHLVLEDSLHLPPSQYRWVICLALLVVIAAASYPLAKVIAHPLERLARTADALGRGDLAVRTGMNRRDEVGMVARAFDEMAERIQRLILQEKELIANVSHELRTPLARIRVALDIAEEGDRDRAKATIADIASDLDELEQIVGDLLTAARLDLGSKTSNLSGTPPLRRQRLRASDLIERAASRFRTTHPERDLAVTIASDGDIEADPSLLRRVVDNLLDNARKYSDAGAPIELFARTFADRWVVEVKDHGIGIDQADLPHVFTPFFRSERSRTRSSGGVGLGLTLARRIVQAHGGEIAIASRPGEGTTVSLSVPSAN